MTVGKVSYGKVRSYVEFNLDRAIEQKRNQVVEELKEKKQWQSWVKAKIDEEFLRYRKPAASSSDAITVRLE